MFLKVFPLVLILSCIANVNSAGYDYPPRKLNLKATAYTHSEGDHTSWGKKTASGNELKYGQRYTSAAADWSFLPLGTEFRIKGLNRHFVIDDYGSALVGKKKVDLYFPSKSSMTKWGVREAEIIITKYGDFGESDPILCGHSEYTDSWYVNQMLTNIQNQQINSDKTDPNLRPIPNISSELDETLMTAASVPKWLWWKKAPQLNLEKRAYTEISSTNESEEENWDRSVIVEPPYTDKAEWEGDPFVVVYAEPVVESVKIEPIVPISEAFYYKETPVRRKFQVVNKRFE